jgi:hypothetical protein
MDFKTYRLPFVAVAVCAGLGLGAVPLRADDDPGAASPQYQPGATGAPLWAEQSAATAAAAATQPFSPQRGPKIIQVLSTVPNAFGHSASYNPAGPTPTEGNAFFTPLGINGRTCATCHVESVGWSITPAEVQKLFVTSHGLAPLFQAIDGANCPTADVSSPAAQLQSSSLLLDKALIRVGEQLPAPPTLQYTIVSIADPYSCNTSPATGLTNAGTTDPATGITSYDPSVPSAGTVSVYRRPLPTTNLPFLSAIMFDDREPSLAQQANDAVLIHMQATTPPTAQQVADIVAFETGLFSAQFSIAGAGNLARHGATGGPVALSAQPFFIGINDPNGGNPTGAAFNPVVYTLYNSWDPGSIEVAALRASIVRGEAIFNQRNFGTATTPKTCSTCHDSPNAGSESDFKLFNTGTGIPGAPSLDLSALPVFTLQCNAGPDAGQTFVTTDPGRAILSGQCADINRFKSPTLRNLAARAPYFHNGSAADLPTLVSFYDAHFSIGLSAQDATDLVNFLSSL